MIETHTHPSAAQVLNESLAFNAGVVAETFATLGVMSLARSGETKAATLLAAGYFVGAIALQRRYGRSPEESIKAKLIAVEVEKTSAAPLSSRIHKTAVAIGKDALTGLQLPGSAKVWYRNWCGQTQRSPDFPKHNTSRFQ